MKPILSRLALTLALTLPLSLALPAPMSAAQTPRPTPRQVFTSFATSTPLNELKFKPVSMSGTAVINTLPTVDSRALPPELTADKAESPKLMATKDNDTVEVETLKPEADVIAEVGIELNSGALEPPAKTNYNEPEIISQSISQGPATPPKLNANTDEIMDLAAEILSAPKTDVVTDLVKPAAPNAVAKVDVEEEPKVKLEASLPPAKKDETDKELGKAKTIIEIAPDLAGPPSPSAKGFTPTKLLPFYTSAADYLAARGIAPQTQVKLTYKITTESANGGLKAAPQTRNITLGPDFAASETEGETRIFDFKTNRLLTLRSTDDDIVFDNISLYAGALSNVNAVNRATNKGKVLDIELSPEVKLGAFWLEASLGWAARSEFGDLNVTRDGNDVTATYGDYTPFETSLTGPDMPSEDHMRVLFAWWHHDLPIHPAILPQIGRPDQAPKSMVILSYSPKFPNGLTTTWELTDSDVRKGAFPLPKTAKTSIEAGKSTPLAFAIASAATGTALTKRPSNDDLRQEIHDKRDSEKYFEAWLTAQMLSDRIGGCAKDPALLCQDIKEIEAKAKLGSDLEKLPDIIRKARRASTRVEGFTLLAPYVEGNIAPAFLVKIAAQARARIKSVDLSDPGVKALRADKLLEEALVKNPYDPVIYRTLGQVYAAQDRLAESWDMQDAMRGLDDVNDKLSGPINWAERSLLVRAPGFFLQDMP